MISSKCSMMFGAIVWLTLTAFAPTAEPISLRAGPVTMVFDTDNVFTRYIRVGSHEVLRGITAPVRPQDWSTISPQLSNLKVENRSDSFQVTFDVICAKDDVDFRWHGSIAGNAKGVIEFSFDGEAHSTFKRNRIGFCVLHGPSAAGNVALPARIAHSAGLACAYRGPSAPSIGRSGGRRSAGERSHVGAGAFAAANR